MHVERRGARLADYSAVSLTNADAAGGRSANDVAAGKVPGNQPRGAGNAFRQPSTSTEHSWLMGE